MFLKEGAVLSDKPGEGPFQRAFILNANTLTLCIDNGSKSNQFKSTLHTVFKDDGSMQVAHFCKGETFNFYIWSLIGGEIAQHKLCNVDHVNDVLTPLYGLKLACC